MKTLYVGNLPFSSSETEIRALFEQFGPVHSVRLLKDRETGKSRGIGFVQMDVRAMWAAIEALDGNSFHGRNLRVNEARPRG